MAMTRWLAILVFAWAAAAQAETVDWRSYVESGQTFSVVFDKTAKKFDDSAYSGEGDPMGTLKGGETYTVIWDDGVFECTGYNQRTRSVGTHKYTNASPGKNQLSLWGRVYAFDGDGNVYDAEYGLVGHLEEGAKAAAARPSSLLKWEKAPLQLSITLIDGSEVMGTPVDTSIRFQTPYLKTELALEQVMNIKMQEDHETATVQMRNGDRLTGVVSQEMLKVATVFGEVDIPVSAISRLRVLATAKTLAGAGPAEVRRLIEEIMGQPRRQPESVACFYSTGISHIDGLIPYCFDMTESFDLSKPHNKYTYHDGRLAKCESFDGNGRLTSLDAIWNNRVEAPVLVVYFKDGGVCEYTYAEYDDLGRLQAYYRFDKSFQLLFCNMFSYRKDSTSVKRFDKNSALVMEHIYEDGGVFRITNGERVRVNTGTREDSIRGPVKHGLKPVYPGYQASAELSRHIRGHL